MAIDTNTKPRKVLGRLISVGIVIAAVAWAVGNLQQQLLSANRRCEIFANFIGIAPQVDGPIIRLNVHDNQLVKEGELLFEIDDRPYRYALERAISDKLPLKARLKTNGEGSRRWLAGSRLRRPIFRGRKRI